MCKVCWLEVPEDLRYHVMRTWRAYSRVHKDKTVAVTERTQRMVEYRAAARDAIATVDRPGVDPGQSELSL